MNLPPPALASSSRRRDPPASKSRAAAGTTAAPAATLRARRRRTIFLTASLTAALAWALIITTAARVPVAPSSQIGHRLALVIGAPHAAPQGLAGVALAALMWLTMMVAMMLPVLMPWIVAFGALATKAWPRRSPYRSAAIFVGGYFGVWIGYSFAAAGIQVALQPIVAFGPRLNAALGGGVLLGVGVYQFSALKQNCLAHCRSPLSFFLARWDDGPAGALRMGFHHGLYCLGCCWALMALSLSLGVMNLLWMAALTLALCAEMFWAGGKGLSRILGMAFIVWGGLLAATA